MSKMTKDEFEKIWNDCYGDLQDKTGEFRPSTYTYYEYSKKELEETSGKELVIPDRIIGKNNSILVHLYSVDAVEYIQIRGDVSTKEIKELIYWCFGLE
jgi:hypothetical protein